MISQRLLATGCHAEVFIVPIAQAVTTVFLLLLLPPLLAQKTAVAFHLTAAYAA